ncbi:MAG: phage portal protein, partial [Eubacteriales bacterium]
MTQTKRVSALLRNSAPLSVPEIVRREIDEFRTSERFHEMLSAARYFENRSDIEKKTNDVSPRLSNARIEHPFYWKFITQKCRYLLARPFSVTTENPDYAGALNDFFDADFRARIRAAASDSIEFGIAFLQPYFDEQGVLRVQKLIPTEVIPLWTDAGHERLDAFIRFYDVVAYVGREKGRITRAEFWDASGVVRMETAFNGTELRVQSTEPHFTVGGKAYNWESPPLVWLRYNDAELPLLRFVKALIDDINWQTSVTSDVLRDVVRCIYVLRGYGGADLAEFVADLRKSLAIKLDADGGVDTLSPQVDTANVLAYLDAARRELYDAASAVDTRDPEL